MEEEIQEYYFALYARCAVSIEPSGYPIEWDDISFYDKTFFCAYLRPSTYKKFTCDDCENLACLAVDEQSQTRYKRNKYITSPEWIEDLSESTTIFVDKNLLCEVDAYDFMEKKGYQCNWTESGVIKYGSWVDKNDLP